jgi:hypothetical protein
MRIQIETGFPALSVLGIVRQPRDASYVLSIKRRTGIPTGVQ